MNESSPIRRETAREYPVETPAPIRRRRGRASRWLLLLLLLGLAGAVAHRMYDARQAPEGATATKHGRGGRHGGGDIAQAVGIATAATGDMPVVLQGLGTVTPLATVTVKSQISGYLTEIGFREGQNVKKGDYLAQVDQRPYEALLAQNQGQLATTRPSCRTPSSICSAIRR